MLDVSLARSVAEMLPYVPEWEHLATRVAEPNVFYEPFMLLPAIERLAPEGSVAVLFFRTREGLLAGVAPLRRHRWAPRYTLWKHRYCYLCTPLLLPGFEDEVVAALVRWLDTRPFSGGLLRLPLHGSDGPFATALRGAAGGYTPSTSATIERAFLQRPAALSASRRKQARNRRRRLEREGPVAFHVATTPEEVARWIPAFLALEDSGWKGREKSSFAAHADDAAWLRAMAEGGATQGRVEIFSLTLADRPIASCVTLRSGPGAFAFKSAYDEAFAAHSPGVLLDVELLDRLLGDPTLQWTDSCADPGHPVLDTLWAGRRRLDTAALTRRSWYGRALSTSSDLAERGFTAVRAHLDSDLGDRLRTLRNELRS